MRTCDSRVKNKWFHVYVFYIFGAKTRFAVSLYRSNEKTQAFELATKSCWEAFKLSKKPWR